MEKLFYNGNIITTDELIEQLKEKEPNKAELDYINKLKEMITSGEVKPVTNFKTDIKVAKPIMTLLTNKQLEYKVNLQNENTEVLFSVISADKATIEEINTAITMETINSYSGEDTQSRISVPGGEIASTLGRGLFSVGKEVLKGVVGVSFHVAGAGISSVFFNTAKVYNNIKNNKDVQKAFSELKNMSKQ